MKKVVLTLVSLIIIALPLMTAKKPKEVNSTALFSLIREYKYEKGFQVVSLGRLGLALLKKAAAANVDKEDKEAIKMLDGLTKLVVVNYEEAHADIKEKFRSKAIKILDGSEKLMQVKEDGETLEIYGLASEDGKTLKDCVIIAPGDDSMICLMGSLPLDKINALVKQSKDGNAD